MTNWYDLTLSREAMDRAGVTEDYVIQWLSKNSSRWAMGRETGDSGYEHLQIRCVTGLSLQDVTNVWKRMGHASRTHAKDFDYVLKDGNAVTSWRATLEKFRVVELRPWQSELKALISLQGDREILVAVDEIGGTGKSYLARHMEACGLAKVIPQMDRAGDMISAAMVCPSDAYIFDIPMAGDKRSPALWKAIETIKNGHLFDWRYQYREQWIDPPRIMVFSNYRPPIEMLAKDRWNIYNIPQTF